MADQRRRAFSTPKRDAEAQAEGQQEVAKAAVKTIKDAIRRGKKVTATITIKLVDAAGNKRTVERTVKLTK